MLNLKTATILFVSFLIGGATYASYGLASSLYRTVAPVDASTRGIVVSESVFVVRGKIFKAVIRSNVVPMSRHPDSLILTHEGKTVNFWGSINGHFFYAYPGHCNGSLRPSGFEVEKHMDQGMIALVTLKDADVRFAPDWEMIAPHIFD